MQEPSGWDWLSGEVWSDMSGNYFFFFLKFRENEGLLHYANEVWAQEDRTSDRLRYCSELGKLA